MSRSFLLRFKASNATPFALRRSVLPVRQFSTSPCQFARKDDQGKDEMKVESNEYSKSGSDNASAAVEDTAFSADKTRPEEQHEAAGKESGDKSNPLNVSPANTDVSQAKGQEGGQEGGNEGSSAQSGEGPSDRERTSGKGKSPKNGD